MMLVMQLLFNTSFNYNIYFIVESTVPHANSFQRRVRLSLRRRAEEELEGVVPARQLEDNIKIKY